MVKPSLCLVKPSLCLVKRPLKNWEKVRKTPLFEGKSEKELWENREVSIFFRGMKNHRMNAKLIMHSLWAIGMHLLLFFSFYFFANHDIVKSHFWKIVLARQFSYAHVVSICEITILMFSSIHFSICESYNFHFF